MQLHVFQSGGAAGSVSSMGSTGLSATVIPAQAVTTIPPHITTLTDSAQVTFSIEQVVSENMDSFYSKEEMVLLSFFFDKIKVEI